MVHVRGLITYHLSPFEQKLFKDFVSSGFAKLTSKVTRNFFDVVPAFAAGAAVYYWTHNKYEEIAHSHRS